MDDLDSVTRITIQTDLGRYEFWSDSWRGEVTDDNRTLFLRGRGAGHYARTQRDMELQEEATQ